MTFWSLLNMIVILGVVWGGFSYCLFLALRRERSKTKLD